MGTTLPHLAPRMTMGFLPALALSIGLFLGSGAVSAFDHRHEAWNALLARNVQIGADGRSSRVSYARLKSERAALRDYLATLSAVTETEYRGWTRNERLAFLINAYNAFTVDLIVEAYPGIASIRELGNFLQSPWKRRFFTLLGQARHLDDLEHGLIRAPGAFDDPRIHFAVVCASVGCPMLRREAWVADRLDSQLDEAERLFLSDRKRNRFDAAAGALQVSRIFDWYDSDFIDPRRNAPSLKAYLAARADLLGDSPPERDRIRRGDFRVEFLDYDWGLNDLR